MEESTTRDNPTFAWKDVDQAGDEYSVMVSVLSQGGMLLTLQSLGERISLDLSDEQAKRFATALTPPADSQRREEQRGA